MQQTMTGIAGWQKNSFIDYPGTVSTVLFFGGCNLRCPYCHNPDIVFAPPVPCICWEEIDFFLQRRTGIIEGVVLTGGEPTLHARLKEIVDSIRLYGYKVKLDTNGLLPERIAAVNPDYLAVDIKTIPELYVSEFGAPYGDVEQRLRRSLAHVKKLGSSAEVRITCVPGLMDAERINSLGPLLSGVEHVLLQNFRPRERLLDQSYAGIRPFGKEEMNSFRILLSEYATRCEIRGDA
ncbi:MAG: anaerobic ribonucleoside-triphosphate reductase activating protein [Chitinivibrionales bacterium]|nr:anaerobic ribonucleoside-triphosphate reductase activating protein [Chitinivibrionales bacterium]